jgi:hypothetical protein
LAGDKVVLGLFAEEEAELGRLGAEGARAASALIAALRLRGEHERVAETPFGKGGRTLTLIGLGKRSELTAERAAGLSSQRRAVRTHESRARRPRARSSPSGRGRTARAPLALSDYRLPSTCRRPRRNRSRR